MKSEMSDLDMGQEESEVPTPTQAAIDNLDRSAISALLSQLKTFELTVLKLKNVPLQKMMELDELSQRSKVINQQVLYDYV